ncbi:cleavage and polyadenylation specificity factor subunit 4 [Aplysia californica]|uniref:Cleavage and polyadenylation specificity factor subunit 4 n=1 Tax=Aplysia californica TaxID=6500 RepID=A0ABM0JD75_APLCA|nr:cleavage and polyadenylation specificity factor subunit 4 [Aplysia californica]
MQEIVAPVDCIKFDIEIALELQKGAQLLPFPGMDKSGAAICTYFLTANCNRGSACPFRHIKGDRSVVCKHWLRGLCKKGDDCEFLHEFDMSKMPECFFFSKFGQCNNKECPFLHIDPENKVRDCPWYDRGFCRHGPNCKNRHVRRIMCQCFLNGFCLDGPNCKYVHPSFKIPEPDPVFAQKKQNILCHVCMQPGHKAIQCHANKQGGALSDASGAQQMSGHGSYGHNAQHQQFNQHQPRERRPMDQITCYKCGEKGHYANKCPKGHLAFLSAANYANQQNAGH